MRKLMLITFFLCVAFVQSTAWAQELSRMCCNFGQRRAW